ncbi:AraC family transcriptional regulator [Flavobacterium sp. LC2016-12]|uniref:helix-turn-helix domain-containing protein n=1 Tax=Flavobacterium sp. LC2016-12 TaxID=2783794 RepID=UPI00188B1955|nr:helix-turn-helix domain-containing protein [Flavobacterium sp. LC2016-12]MBF4466452.1 AraC family transcriptional regulator [Flavobacterium sp. LC2016-12]
MNVTGLNNLIIILIFGSLILLSFLKITNPLNVNKKANFCFGVFLLLWATFWMDELALLIGFSKINVYLNVIIHFIQFFTPLVLYFSIVFFTNPNYKFSKYDLKYLILPFIFLALLVILSIKSSAFVHLFSIVLMLIQSLFYVLASYLKIRKHKKNTLVFSSNANEIDLSWLEYIILSLFLMSIIITIYNMFFFLSTLNIFLNGISFIIILIISHYSLKQKEIFPLDEKQRSQIILINEQEDLIEAKRKVVSDEELVALKIKLHQVMLEQQPYLDSELNLIKLSELVKSTPHQVSYAINSGFNENFFHFINKYRVERAKKLLVNDKMKHFSILGIAYESGFNSKTSFNSTFKKITNQTPSEFKKKRTDL